MSLSPSRASPAACRTRLRPPGKRPDERRLTSPDSSRSHSSVPTRPIQTETLRDTRDIYGQGLGQRTHLPGRVRGPPTTVGEHLTCGYTADALVAGAGFEPATSGL